RQLQVAIRQATGDIRRLAHDLRPPALDELGLVEALRERVAQYAAPPHIGITVAATLPPLSAAVEVAAYRIVQEALMNVLRHAHAHTCQVRLAPAGSSLEVEIRDDGVGIPKTVPRFGVGLRSMQERAEELGGECRIERSDLISGGTRVVARLPF